jgi:hypothetical protein
MARGVRVVIQSGVCFVKAAAAQHAPSGNIRLAPSHVFGGTGLPTGVFGEAEECSYLRSGCARCTGQETSATKKLL